MHPPDRSTAVLGALALLAAAPFAAAPLAAAFSPGDAPGRLPKDVVPIAYAIEITPHPDTLVIDGRESVSLRVLRPTATIQFNSLNESLREVRFDGAPVARVVSDDATQMTTVTLRKPAAAGVHRLRFDYAGKLESQPHGLFLQPYTARDGKSGRLLSTQMEATDARRMFPCWDEPAFRATFALTATVPAEWAAVANMPIRTRTVHGALATTRFEVSPRMPSYLVEFSAGDLGVLRRREDGIDFGVWAVRGLEGEGATALANARTILADYNDYFAYRYPLPKLDSIAVPGGFQGAMENWGAITYNDQTLLLSASSTLADRQTVFTIQAHEMAHQWNGDLVTMAWWDDIWLNESFASWMAARETALRNPDWHWWEGQDEDKESAMDADARATSHAIRQHVTDELQAATSFDPQITYSKGQAILRMFEAYLGEETFRDGIRGYMRAHAFSNATTGDLWRALGAASHRDVGALVSGWTEKPGFPLVNVAANCDAAGARTITLTQQRFLARGTEEPRSSWSVPLQVRAGLGAPRSVLLSADGQREAAGRCDEPLSIDAGAIGYYRARYDDSTLKLDTERFGTLPDADRIALLDDQWALVESGMAELPSYLALAGRMGGGLDARAWQQIAAALAEIEFDERGKPGHDAFAAYARTALKPAFAQLGWQAKPNETPDLQSLRRKLVRELGALGDADVAEEARRRFAAFSADPQTLSPDAQAMILPTVAQTADAATFEQLHALAKAAKNETEIRRYYSALMRVSDPTLAKRAADIALSPEIVPQADALRLQLILTLAERHPALSWDSFKSHHERILQPFAMEAELIVAQYLPDVFWSGVPLDELDSWIRAHVKSGMSPSVDRGMETARSRLATRDRLVSAADAYLQSSSASTAGR